MTPPQDHGRIGGDGVLLQLAERCEKATGPDRELDGEIHAALNPDKQTVIGHEPGRFPRKAIFGPISRIMEEIGGKDGADYIGAPPYTASLDAAMTLMPENYDFGVGRITGDGSFLPCEADVSPSAQPYDVSMEGMAEAATPALALTAACLRARAALARSGEAS